MVDTTKNITNKEKNVWINKTILDSLLVSLSYMETKMRAKMRQLNS